MRSPTSSRARLRLRRRWAIATARSAGSRTRRPPTTARSAARCSSARRAGRRRWRSRRTRPTRSDRRSWRISASKGRHSSSARAAAGRGDVPAGARADHDRPLAGMRHLSRRRHGLAPACRRQAQRPPRDRGRGQPQRHVPEPAPNRVIRPPGRRRRAPDRQISPHLPEMSTLAPLIAAASRPAEPASGGGSPRWRRDALRACVPHTVPSGLPPPARGQEREERRREG